MLLSNFLEYLIVFFLLFNGNMVWKYFPNGPIVGGGHDSNIAGFTACFIMFIYIILKTITAQSARVKRKKLYIWGIAVGYAIVFAVINRYNYVAYFCYYVITIAVMIPFCWSANFRGRWKEFLIKYSNLVSLLALSSLIMYFGGVVFHIIPSHRVLLIRNGLTFSYDSYLGMLYTYQTERIFGVDMVRNCGLFLEGPGFAFPLSVAVFTEFFAREKISKTRVTILIVTIITVFSFKSYIAVPIIILLKLFQKPEERAKIRKFIYRCRAILFPIAIITITLIIRYFMNMKVSSDINSYLARTEDTVVAFNVWKNNFLFGVGFNNTAPFKTLLTQEYASITCGVLKLLAQCGIFLGIEYYGGMVLMVHCSNKLDWYALLVWFIIIMFFLFTSSTCYDYFFLLFVSMGISNLYY